MKNKVLSAINYQVSAFLTVLTLFAIVPAIAQDDPAPINPAIGEWNLTMTLGADEHPSNLIISEINGELKGIWSSRLGTLDLDNITYEEGTLTFKHSLEVAGETLNFHFEGEIDNGDITGHFISGGDRASVTGKKIQQPDIVGVWEVTAEEAGESKTYTLTITPNMLGTYTGDDQEFAVTNVEQLEDRVTFDISAVPHQPEAEAAEDDASQEESTGDEASEEDTAEDEAAKKTRAAREALEEAERRELAAKRREFDGTLSDDLLQGDIYVDGQKINTLTGKRKGSTVALTGFAAFAGTWELSVDSQIGGFQNQLVINPGGSGMYISDDQSELRDLRIEGEWLMFITTVHVQGAQYEVEFEGKLNEEGILLGDFYLDGSAVARIEGTRSDDD